MTYQKIWVGQDVVGWLTIDELNIDNAPRADRYLQQQISYTLWVAGIGILIAGAFSFFLSRHITAPIKILNDSAAEIAKRNFQTHISVNTKDELNELANSFNHISKELLRFENRQKQWLIDISHDLRTPLTILNGEMQAMNDDVIPCNKDTIISLQEEVDLLIRLVDDLHELSMMDSAEFYCLDEDVELKQLTLNQLQKYNTKYSSRKINVHHNIELASIVIRGDQNRLAQVIHNILENNFRYTESSGDIWVSLKEDQDWASIIIEDSGPGVSEFALVKLFDRLFRTDSSRNRKTGGAGIGLAICHNIIKAHGGLISAQQSQYGGLSIIIQLPIKSEVRD
ncbi:MAG: HAMP domain-containing protein [Paraglaciecola sp.]|nr:HAMP domain-containing protein [Paraglaciecola sp.]